MSAPTGNSNATKWTEARTLFLLERIEKYALMDHVQTLSRALVKARIYKGIWTYWKHRWSKHEDIMDRICYIEQIFMMKIEEGGLSKRWHAGMCLFMLRVNYGQGEEMRRKWPSDELPAHLVTAYNSSRAEEERIKKQEEEKARQEEKERAAKERAEKKAAKLHKQTVEVMKKQVNAGKPELIVYKNASTAENSESIPVVDINRGREGEGSSAGDSGYGIIKSET